MARTKLANEGMLWLCPSATSYAKFFTVCTAVPVYGNTCTGLISRSCCLPLDAKVVLQNNLTYLT